MVKIKQLFLMLWPEVGFGSQKNCATRKNTSLNNLHPFLFIYKKKHQLIKLADNAHMLSELYNIISLLLYH